MDVSEITTSTDTDALWKALTAAKADNDHERVRAIENRMRVLMEERRFAHLTDEELASQIAGLDAGRRAGTKDMIAHAPAGGNGGGGNDDAGQITVLNNGIRENQSVGINQTLSALLDEQARRAKS